MSIRVGDLVLLEGTYNLVPGLVIKTRKREVASPHPNFRGKHLPVEVKVERKAEVVWPNGEVGWHPYESLIKVKKENES